MFLILRRSEDIKTTPLQSTASKILLMYSQYYSIGLCHIVQVFSHRVSAGSYVYLCFHHEMVIDGDEVKNNVAGSSKKSQSSENMSQDLGDPQEKTLDESSDPEVYTFWTKVVNTDWAYTEPALNFLTDN